MAERAEVLAQISRMLGDDGLRSASDPDVRTAAATHPDRLEAALINEAAASDDVSDVASALFYLERRLGVLATVLDPETIQSLRTALTARVERW